MLTMFFLDLGADYMRLCDTSLICIVDLCTMVSMNVIIEQFFKKPTSKSKAFPHPPPHPYHFP